MRRISLDDLLHTRQKFVYQGQYGYIMKLLEKGQIKPVKASKSNGKKPALYREYWMVEEQFESIIDCSFFSVKAVRFFLCTVECRSIMKSIFCIKLKAVIERRSANQTKVCDAKLQGL